MRLKPLLLLYTGLLIMIIGMAVALKGSPSQPITVISSPTDSIPTPVTPTRVPIQRTLSPTNTPAPDRPIPNVTLPENFPQGFVQYARIDRKDNTIRDLYINHEAAAEIAQWRGRLPNGTIIVIDGYDAVLDENGAPLYDENGWFIKGDSFDRIHMVEKRYNWAIQDFVSEVRSGNWNFASYDAVTHAPFFESINACFNCHNSAAATDFIYSRQEILNFARTGEVQHVRCNQTGRTPCNE